MRGGEWQQGVGGFFAVYKAYLRCRRRKRTTPQAQFYEAYLLDNLMETVQALRMGHWRPHRPVCFMVDKPKAREIHAAHYSDRVVWQDRLVPLWQPQQVSSYKSQQIFFRRTFPSAQIAIQCGCACEWFTGIKQPSKVPEDNPRYAVSKVVVRQQGYLKGGLRRRCVESLIVPPLSETGVLLCKTVSS